MRLLFLGSIRRSLLVLVLMALLPSLVILLYSGRELRSRVVLDAEDYTLRQVKSMATHHERVVDNARLLLMALARSSDVRKLDVAACREVFADILAGNEAYVSLSLADVSGHLLVRVPEGAEERSAQQTFFQQAASDAQFTVGEYSLLAQKRRVVVPFGQAVVNDAKQVIGVLVAEFDLRSFGGIFSYLHLPEHSVFTVTDANGMRLTRFPETEKYTWVADLPQMVTRMSGEQT